MPQKTSQEGLFILGVSSPSDPRVLSLSSVVLRYQPLWLGGRYEPIGKSNMVIDKEYLKGLLEAIQSSDTPTTDIKELDRLGFSYEDDKFIFHTDILIDKGYLESIGPFRGVGYQIAGNNQIDWKIVPIRLTASGHEFIESLNEPDVWESIQSNFKEASLDTLIVVAKDLATGFAKQKVKALLESCGS